MKIRRAQIAVIDGSGEVDARHEGREFIRRRRGKKWIDERWVGSPADDIVWRQLNRDCQMRDRYARVEDAITTAQDQAP